jgi:predicted phosphate transport protein (TIGR00153 family)
MGFRLSFLPRDEQFFDLFKQMADEIRMAATLLEELFAVDPPNDAKVDLIKDAEHRCDALTHDTIQRLHRTFVTPFDREDLYALATSLDDVMDAIDAAAGLVRLYRLESVRVGARELARIVTASADQVRLAVGAMQEHKGLMPHAIEVNRLENEADRVHHQAVSKLFEEERDPLKIMKWKETFDFLEDASDRCEDVANVIEGVMVKHG